MEYFFKEFNVLPSQFKKELQSDLNIVASIHNSYKNRSREIQQLQQIKQNYFN